MDVYGLVFNPSDSPQAVDDDGRVVGGREWSPAHLSADQVKANLDAGRLVLVDDLGDNPRPDLVRLFEAAGELGERSKAFAAMDDNARGRLAASLELGTFPGKAELVHALTMHPAAKPPRAKD